MALEEFVSTKSKGLVGARREELFYFLLPNVYREMDVDQDLRTLLRVFESEFIETRARADCFFDVLDVNISPARFLPEFMKMLGLDVLNIQDTADRRRLIKEAVHKWDRNATEIGLPAEVKDRTGYDTVVIEFRDRTLFWFDEGHTKNYLDTFVDDFSKLAKVDDEAIYWYDTFFKYNIPSIGVFVETGGDAGFAAKETALLAAINKFIPLGTLIIIIKTN